MRRFFFPFDQRNQHTIIIDDVKECHHIKNVMRFKSGDAIVLFNGKGLQAHGIIEEITEGKVLVKIEKIEEKKNALPRLILGCALPKKSKFELIIEKATELGVSDIIPLETKRTVVKIKEAQIQEKTSRFNKIALAAAKQCGRGDLPVVHPVGKFKSTVDWMTENSKVVIPCLEGKKKLIKDVVPLLKESPAISFLIGPEGDFTAEEYAYAINKGCMPVSLGPLVLRVETAAIAVLTFAAFNFHS